MSTEHGHEIEIKLRASSPAEVNQKLTAAGFGVTRERVFEANVVFDTTDQVLRSRHCLLRLREAGGKATLTYKGEPLEGKYKNREELELQLSDASVAGKILERLGFSPAFRYEKYRTEFTRPGEPGSITLDETPIGTFLELEGPPDWIDRTAAQLGYRESDYLTASYVGLYIEYCREHHLEVRDMVFDTALQY